MRALLHIWPREGHFPWCPRLQTLAFQYTRGRGHSCDRCKLSFYIFAFVVMAAVAGMEFWGSKQTGSGSLFADAWHMVSDNLGYLIGGISLVLALRGMRSALWKGRFERLAAGLVFAAGVYMLWGAVMHLARGEPSLLTSNRLFVVVTFIGLMTNVFMYFLMRALRVEHPHGHGHEHHEDALLESNILHTIGDALASVCVLANAGLSWWFEGAEWVGYLDLYLSGFIASWLLYQSWKILDPFYFPGDN